MYLGVHAIAYVQKCQKFVMMHFIWEFSLLFGLRIWLKFCLGINYH